MHLQVKPLLYAYLEALASVADGEKGENAPKRAIFS